MPPHALWATLALGIIQIETGIAIEIDLDPQHDIHSKGENPTDVKCSLTILVSGSLTAQPSANSQVSECTQHDPSQEKRVPLQGHACKGQDRTQDTKRCIQPFFLSFKHPCPS